MLASKKHPMKTHNRERIAMAQIAKLSLVLVATIMVIALFIFAGFTRWQKEQPMPSNTNPPPSPNVSAQDMPQAGAHTAPPASSTLRYWTPERLRDAKPAPMPLIDSSALPPDVRPPTSEETPASIPGQLPADRH